MAFPTVPTVASGDLLSTATTTASTTHTFPNLSSLRGGAGPQAGDLLVAVCVQYSGTSGGSPNDQFSAWGASFTETRDDETTTANNLAVGVAHKIAAGTESGTFTVTSAFAARSVNFLMRIPAATWHGTTIPEVLAVVRASGAVPDPGSFDPANWAAEETLWISVYGHSETSTTGNPPIIDTPPTNYTGQLIVARNADAVGHITAAVAFRQLDAAAEDVEPWTVSNANRGNGAATVIAIRPKTVTTVESGTLSITGSGAVTVSESKQDHISAIAFAGTGAVTIANTKQDHLTSLSVSGAGAITVGGSVQDHLIALSLDGTGVVTIDGSVQDHLTALAILGNGSVALGATRQDHITAIDFAAGSSIAITSSEIVADAISSGDLDLTGVGAITIADSVVEVLSGDLNMVGSGAINIIGSLVEALSGALTINSAGSITITDTDYTALSGLLDITGNGRITILLPGASASALAHPNRGIISEHSKVVKLAVNAERYRLKANSAGNDRKPIVLSGSWILGVQVDYIDAGASTDVYIGDGSRTILDVQGSNTDVYLPMREEVVDATGAGLGVYEPPLITQGLYITIANAGNGGQVYVTVLYQ